MLCRGDCVNNLSPGACTSGRDLVGQHPAGFVTKSALKQAFFGGSHGFREGFALLTADRAQAGNAVWTVFKT
jgi:hypothetical protein